MISKKEDYQMYLNELYVLRWIGAMIYNTNVAKGFQKDPDKLLILPEMPGEETQRKLTTREEAAEIFNWKI